MSSPSPSPVNDARREVLEGVETLMRDISEVYRTASPLLKQEYNFAFQFANEASCLVYCLGTKEAWLSVLSDYSRLTRIGFPLEIENAIVELRTAIVSIAALMPFKRFA